MDYVADHQYAPQPSEDAQGYLHAACTCGWWDPENFTLDRAARQSWKAHMVIVMAAKPRTKG